MEWKEVCERADLQNLPFKIELTEHGKLLMTPVNVTHSAYQSEIAALLRQLMGRHVLTECAIATSKGTKVADVAWMSRERFSTVEDQLECSIAPEICVEVESPSNTEKEFEEKRQLYFEKGCLEFWICSKQGALRFFSLEGQQTRSVIVPDFPTQVEK